LPQARGQGQPVAEEDYFTGTVEDGGFSFRRTDPRGDTQELSTIADR
jgi:hypothetical protein